MHALIIDNNPRRLEQGQLAFLEEGVQITGTGAYAVARICIDRFPVDVLVIDRRSAGKKFAELVRMAERRNPGLVSIALTPDVSGDTDRMVQAFPSMHCVLGADLAPSVAAKLAMASIVQQDAAPMTPQDTRSAVPCDDDIKLQQPAVAPQAQMPLTQPVPQHAPQMPPQPIPQHAPDPLPQHAQAADWQAQTQYEDWDSPAAAQPQRQMQPQAQAQPQTQAQPQAQPQPQPNSQPQPPAGPQISRVHDASGVQVARVIQDEQGQVARVVRNDQDQQMRSVSPVFSSIRRVRRSEVVAA